MIQVFGLMLLSASVPFTDALPPATKKMFSRAKLLFIALHSAAIYGCLKLQTAKMYSLYGPTELLVAGKVSLSSYRKCTGEYMPLSSVALPNQSY